GGRRDWSWTFREAGGKQDGEVVGGGADAAQAVGSTAARGGGSRGPRGRQVRRSARCGGVGRLGVEQRQSHPRPAAGGRRAGELGLVHRDARGGQQGTGRRGDTVTASEQAGVVPGDRLGRGVVPVEVG